MSNQKLLHAVAVRAFVVSAINDPDCEALSEESTEKQKLEFFFSRFQSEYGHQVQRLGGVVPAMVSYLMGLPSTIDTPFYYVDIQEKMIEWGYLKENSTDPEISFAMGDYWNKIATALSILARRHGIID